MKIPRRIRGDPKAARQFGRHRKIISMTGSKKDARRPQGHPSVRLVSCEGVCVELCVVRCTLTSVHSIACGMVHANYWVLLDVYRCDPNK